MTLRARWAAGLLAAGPAVLALVGWHLVTARPGLLEAISDGFVAYVPLDVFSAAIGSLGPLAKGLLYVGIATGVVIAGALLAPLLLRWTRERPWQRAGVLMATAVLAFAELLVLPLFRAGF